MGPALAITGILLALGLGRKRTTKKKPVEPVEEIREQSCGLYPWLPEEVDDEALRLIDEGFRDVDEIAGWTAVAVYPKTPEGTQQVWPPGPADARAQCLLDRIRIRVNLLLAEVLDEEAGGDEECPEGERFDEETQSCVPITTPAPIPVVRVCPEGMEWDDERGECIDTGARPGEAIVCPPGTLPDLETGECYPDYPKPGPWNVEVYEHPENYPQPGTFHQVGGPNSAEDLGKIARMALAQFGALIQDDPQWALDQANKAKLWKAYRAIINCVPTNHAYFASKNQPGTPYHYPTPHGYHIVLFPRHDDVRQAMLDGRVPERFADPDNPIGDGRPGNPRHHAWIWLPPLDPVAYLRGEVVVLREYWDTGDWKLMPPPEFTTWAINEGIPGLPEDLAWTTLGCEEYWEWEAA